MILLNFEKQYIYKMYMYRGRRRRRTAAAAAAAAAAAVAAGQDEGGGGRGGGGGIFGCNYDKHRNLPYFPYHFTI